MAEPTLSELVADLRAKLAAASLGPWFAETTSGPPFVGTDDPGHEAGCTIAEARSNDCILIAAAVNALPRLLDTAERVATVEATLAETEAGRVEAELAATLAATERDEARNREAGARYEYSSVLIERNDARQALARVAQERDEALLNVQTAETDAHMAVLHELDRYENDLVEKSQRLAAVESQLPDGMKHCTIRFIECERGHGRLTATNWIDHGCGVCRLAAVEAVARELVRVAEDAHTAWVVEAADAAAYTPAPCPYTDPLEDVMQRLLTEIARARLLGLGEPA